MDWSKLPDLAAVALLTCAFASVAYRGRSAVSGLWLTGWLLIDLHFAAFVFQFRNTLLANLMLVIGFASLVWAGVIFMWACVPYRDKLSSRLMLSVLLGANTLYLVVLVAAPSGSWMFVPAAALLGIGPLLIALVTARTFFHPLRLALVCTYCGLSAFLLFFQYRPNGSDLALNAILFTVYLGCCIHFWATYERATTGTFITIAGFAAWASVFVVAPLLEAFYPNAHIENEVWNLPKYVVAVGMILLQLEDQIAHNRHLALHDELTGLPNRRLFEDRLNGALERARRTGTQTALLLVDLDRFKEVNDTVGHHIGDLLLQRVGQLFNGRVRRSDTVARTGGDEFSIILESPASREIAGRVGSSLIQLLEEPFDLEGHSVRVGGSVGIAVFPEDATDAASLRIAADRRMYGDKNAGRSSEPNISGPHIRRSFPGDAPSEAATR
ncbi:MAG TPA: GGDEF domain-containing protein [Terracidiphilus sp.]|nr:GGDEF domain-containing protein [Terracidiphilus sp.]